MISRKECSPAETIERIVFLLKKNSIEIVEKNFSVEGVFFSTRLELKGFSGCGVNGKGVTIDYARASAYAELKSLFTKEEQVLIESLLRAFEKIEQADIVPVFAHGDLHFENLLYDPASNKLTGMIDFGGASYVDPYYDLRYFWDCGIETIADAAGIQLTENVWTRILFHHLCNEFDSLVCHIKRNKDYTDELQYTKKIIALLCHFY